MTPELVTLLRERALDLQMVWFTVSMFTEISTWTIVETTDKDYVIVGGNKSSSERYTCTLSRSLKPTEEFLKYAQDLEIMFL